MVDMIEDVRTIIDFLFLIKNSYAESEKNEGMCADLANRVKLLSGPIEEVAAEVDEGWRKITIKLLKDVESFMKEYTAAHGYGGVKLAWKHKDYRERYVVLSSRLDTLRGDITMVASSLHNAKLRALVESLTNAQAVALANPEAVAVADFRHFQDDFVEKGPLGASEGQEALRQLRREAPPQAVPVREIAPNEVHMMDRLGRGGFGEVWHGVFEGRQVAVKSIASFGAPAEMVVAQKAMRQEVEILAPLRHHAILQVLGACTTDLNNFLIIMELANCSLHDLLPSPSTAASNCLPRTPEVLAPLLLDIAVGMRYLHAQRPPIVHRDIKPRNILIFDGLRAKIADFGMAKLKEVTAGSTVGHTAIVDKESAGGTEHYMAPENFEDKMSTKSDVFSFGVLTAELLAGEAPWRGVRVNCGMIPAKVIQGQRPFPLPDGGIEAAFDGDSALQELRRLAEAAWAGERAQRPDFTAICDQLTQRVRKSGDGRTAVAAGLLDAIAARRGASAGSAASSGSLYGGSSGASFHGSGGGSFQAAYGGGSTQYSGTWTPPPPGYDAAVSMSSAGSAATVAAGDAAAASAEPSLARKRSSFGFSSLKVPSQLKVSAQLQEASARLKQVEAVAAPLAANDCRGIAKRCGKPGGTTGEAAGSDCAFVVEKLTAFPNNENVQAHGLLALAALARCSGDGCNLGLMLAAGAPEAVTRAAANGAVRDKKAVQEAIFDAVDSLTAAAVNSAAAAAVADGKSGSKAAGFFGGFGAATAAASAAADDTPELVKLGRAGLCQALVNAVSLYGPARLAGCSSAVPVFRAMLRLCGVEENKVLLCRADAQRLVVAAAADRVAMRAPDVEQLIWRLLARLYGDEDPGEAPTAARAIVTAMAAGLSDAELQESGCFRIAELSSSAGGALDAGQAGDFAAVTAALLAHPSHPGVATHGCRALASLATEPQNHELVTDDVCAAVITTVMQRSLPNEALAAACKALSDLASYSELRERLVRNGACAAAAEALTSRSVRPGVAKEASSAVRSLAMCSEARPELLQYGAVPALRAVENRFRKDKSIMWHVTWALTDLEQPSGAMSSRQVPLRC